MWCSEFVAYNREKTYYGIYLSTKKVIDYTTIPIGFSLYYSIKSRKRKSNILNFLKRNLKNMNRRIHCGGLHNLKNSKIKFIKSNKLFTEFDYEQIKLGQLGVAGLVFKQEYEKLKNKKR